MNSCVPKELSSVTPPQLVFTMLRRFSWGPMPSRQWYSSAKQPPGQRSTGMRMAFMASTTSVRIPFTLGMLLSFPTKMPP